MMIFALSETFLTTWIYQLFHCLSYFFDEMVLKRLLDSTLEYAKFKKEEKCKRNHLFMRQKLTVTELKAYLGVLLLLGIHSVWNHRKAWSTVRVQVLICLCDLLTVKGLS